MQIDITHIGTEREPVIVMDGFTGGRVEPLIDRAMKQDFLRTSPHFPGPRAKAPLEVLQHRDAEITRLAREVFGVNALQLVSHDFSLITTPPQQLSPIQRLPHFDGLVPQLALLLYLRPAGQGGTAWYRQRATGFETVTEERMETYQAELHRAVDAHGLPDGYTVGSSDIFEEIHRVEAVPDRAVLYRGRTLHSGVISDALRITPDATTTRLTLNTFLAVTA